MDDCSFLEAVEEIKQRKKKKNKKIKKHNIVCDCGVLEHYFHGWKPWHDKDCIINKGERK